MENRFKHFTDNEAYILRRALAEFVKNYVLEEKYTKSQIKMAVDLMYEVSENYAKKEGGK